MATDKTWGSAFLMRRLLTGYVVGFNRRHHRCGQLLQERIRDSRILGEPAFVHSVLAEAQQTLDRGYLLHSRGWDFDRVLVSASSAFDLPVQDALRSGRQRPRALAGGLGCYWAVRELGLLSAGLGWCFNMTAVGVHYAGRRGKRFATAWMLVLTE